MPNLKRLPPKKDEETKSKAKVAKSEREPLEKVQAMEDYQLCD
jgi:hypothetical protein